MRPRSARAAVTAFVAAVLVGACGVSPLDTEGHGGTTGPGDDVAGLEIVPEGQAAPVEIAWRGTVDVVIDGDTVWVEVVDPNGHAVTAGEVRKLRLLRIDTPEVGRDGDVSECLADEATAELERLTPVGSTVYAVYDVEHQDRFGRDLVHLYTEDGTWVNGTMLSRGYANVVTFQPNDAMTREVLLAERYAREHELGLWAPDACA